MAERPARSRTTAVPVSADADLQRVLEARSVRAARRPPAPDATRQLPVLRFRIGANAFGVEPRHVLEVCSAAGLTSIPCTPPHIAGVLPRRGRILAVVDLAVLLGIAPAPAEDVEHVVVLQGDGMEFGLRVHGVEGVAWVPEPTADPSHEALMGRHARLFLGISGQALAILDGGRLLADPNLKVTGRGARQLPAPPEEA